MSALPAPVVSLLNERGIGFAPTRHLRWLEQRREPPNTTTVWIGAVRSVGITPSWTHVEVLNEPEAPPAYVAAFTVGHLLFQVFGLDDPTVRPINSVDTNFTDERVLTQIWPRILPDVVWPPRN